MAAEIALVQLGYPLEGEIVPHCFAISMHARAYVVASRIHGEFLDIVLLQDLISSSHGYIGRRARPIMMQQLSCACNTRLTALID